MKNIFNSALIHQGFRRYFFNTSWLFAEKILRLITGLLVGIWVARYLGPEKFGIFSYAIAFAAIFSSIAKLGLDGVIVRNLVHEPDQRDRYLGTAFWLKLSGAFVTLVAIALIVQFTDNSHATNIYILIIASGTIFQAFEVIDFYFQSKVLSKLVSICKLIQLLLSSLLKLYLIFIGADLIWFVLVSLLDQITLASTLYFSYRNQKQGKFYFHFDLEIAKQLLKDSWPLILSGLVIMIYMRIDQIMIKEMLGEKEVGYYTAATMLSEAWYFIPIIITSSLFPAIISARKTSKVFYYARLRMLYSFMVWMAIAIALPMTFMSDRIIILLYGTSYADAGQVLMIHIWAGVFVFLGVAFSRYLMVENLNKKAFYRTLLGAVVNVFLNYILIPKYGISGAAIATLCAQFFANYGYDFFDKALYAQLKLKTYAIFKPLSKKCIVK